MCRLPAIVLLLSVALGGSLPSVAQAQEPEAAEQTPADEPASRPRPAPQTRGEALAAGLQRQLETAAQIELGGDDRFLALWQPANTAKPRGVVVIVPGEGETADWPRAVGPLRRGLAAHGWHTLSLTPDDPELSPGPRLPPPEPSAAADKPTGDSDSETEQPAAPPDSAGYLPEQTAPADSDEPDATAAEQDAPRPSHAERMQARLAAAIEHARTLQAPTITLLGHGTGAYWAARYLAQTPSKEIAQLVLVDPRALADAEKGLDDDLAKLAVGIGDFHTGDRPVAQRQAMQRRNAMRRAGHPDYRQVALPNLEGDRYGDQEQLVRRVRGWLERKPVR
jgi:pimeloyl-ACP methyl ester carboxylesterase